jgi:5-hydroxyisourate hydrolase
MSRISTHVLDLARGRPATDVPVRLERRELLGDWMQLGTSRTDGDGRCTQLLPENESLPAGLYRLVFDIGSYHRSREIEGFYPVVELTFHVREGDSQFHIPLLLSPYGYTTYRGS